VEVCSRRLGIKQCGDVVEVCSRWLGTKQLNKFILYCIVLWMDNAMGRFGQFFRLKIFGAVLV